MMTKLSEHFSLEELTASSKAAQLKIDNTAPEAVIESLRKLCENVLEPIREHFDSPVKVTSGYRCPQLNKAVGGNSKSQHVLGEAADWFIIGVDNLDVCKWIAASNIQFDQLILEMYGVVGSWIHISHKSVGNRRQVLRANKVNGKIVYSAGLPSK